AAGGEEGRPHADIIELARQYGRYGYRKVAALLRQAGWTINDKRIERIWQREGLKVPHKQPKRGILHSAAAAAAQSCLVLHDPRRAGDERVERPLRLHLLSSAVRVQSVWRPRTLCSACRQRAQR